LESRFRGIDHDKKGRARHRLPAYASSQRYKESFAPQLVTPHTLSPQSIEKALVAHCGLNLANG
jgi:hypothetical protein